MKVLKVRNATRGCDLGQKIRAASSLVERGLGLLLTPALGSGEGMWLEPCTSVHTFFMRYPIDVLFVDASGVAIGRQTLAPWRISRWYRKSRRVLELAAGTLEKTGTQVGDCIEWEGARA